MQTTQLWIHTFCDLARRVGHCVGVMALACGDVNAAESKLAPSPAPSALRELLLSGEDWQITSFEPGQGLKRRAFAEGYPATEAIPAIVPGDVHWDLERAGKIPPIYYGTNSQAIGWVAGQEWWYRKYFSVPAGWRGKRVTLRFDAVDYLAEIWLNGHSLGRHEVTVHSV